MVDVTFMSWSTAAGAVTVSVSVTSSSSLAVLTPCGALWGRGCGPWGYVVVVVVVLVKCRVYKWEWRRGEAGRYSIVTAMSALSVVDATDPCGALSFVDCGFKRLCYSFCVGGVVCVRREGGGGGCPSWPLRPRRQPWTLLTVGALAVCGICSVV